jgi:ABC-2 type transport system permease protein
MFADAVSAESLRFLRNRSTVFWSVLFVPIASLVISTISVLVMRANTQDMAELVAQLGAGGAPVDLGELLPSLAVGLANPAMLLFLTIGAATLYAGDYRWETWRLITGRNTRLNLMAGKVAVLALTTVAAMLVMLVMSIVNEVIKAAVFERPLAFSVDGDIAGQFLGLFGLSWLRLMQFTMIALMMAVLSRSLLAALFTPLALGAAQAIGAPMFLGMGLMPDGWTTLLLLPGTAFDAIVAVIQQEMGAPTEALPKALLGLALWTAVPLSLALWLFNRQDLSKE